ncbi:hypothetical protein EIP86_005150 [Pleurotus ostreatoroseus]|nr:hypothetical protein EIP86_005150 [Pleurotus ostreatoroseus]
MEDIEERRRSVSRGREAFVRTKSTGRGGAGNIHASPSVGPDNEIDYSPSRGREVDVDPDHAKSSGRGGLGNIRSRSRAHSASVVPEGFPQTASIVQEHTANTAAYEQRVIEEASKPGAIHSSGRGGAGNISGSRSRSRGPSSFFGGGDAKLHSTGRGGAGNLQSSDLQTLDSRQDAELYGPFSEDGVHSTGRGGRANIVNAQSPPLEPLSPHAQAYENSGRGGAGNIRTARSKSRDPNSPRSRSRDPISRIWQKVTHAHNQAQAQRQDIQEEPAPTAHAHTNTNGGGGAGNPEHATAGLNKRRLAAHRQRALLRRVGSPGSSLFEHEDRSRPSSPSHASLNTLTTSASTSSLTTLSSYDPPATPPPFSFPQPSVRAHLLSPPTSPLSSASAYGAPTHDKFSRSAPSLRSLQSLPTLHEDLEYVSFLDFD